MASRRKLSAIESIRHELESTARTAEAARKLLDVQVKSIDRAFPTLNIQQKLDAVATINNVVKAAHTSMVGLARALTVVGEMVGHNSSGEDEALEDSILGDNYGG